MFETLVGVLTFLVIFFWPTFILFGHPMLREFDWYYKLSRERQGSVINLIWLGGLILIVVAWFFVLPDWWIAATPLWVDGR